MALDAFSVLLGILDLLRIALILAIPAFIIGLVALFVKNKLSEKFNFSWIQSTAIATYLAVTIILIFLYGVPYFLALGESQLAQETAPGILAPTAGEIITVAALSIIKILVNALVLTILILPLEFFAAFVSEKLKEKKIPKIAKTFIASYCTCLLATIIVFFAFPWMIAGIIYLIFWG